MIFYFIIGRKFFIIRYDATVFQHKSEPVLQMLMFFSLPLQSFALLDVVILFKYLFINKFLIYFFNYEVFFLHHFNSISTVQLYLQKRKVLELWLACWPEVAGQVHHNGALAWPGEYARVPEPAPRAAFQPPI